MANSPRARGAAPARAAPKATADASPFNLPAAAPMLKVAQQLRRWTDNVLGIAGSASELSLNLAKARASEPRPAGVAREGRLDVAPGARSRRHDDAGAGPGDRPSTDPDLLEQAEIGKAALPMEVVLRLASVLGRRDPVPFAMKLARTYNPQLWKALDALGIGSLVALAGRERELANCTAATTRRAGCPTTTSPRCWASPRPPSTWR